MREDIKPILQELKKRLKDTYEDRLRSVVLFGSSARDDFTEESDVDVLVVLKSITDFDKDFNTMILEGKYDFVFPLSGQETMKDNIKNSRLVIFEKSGHMAAVEEPELFQQTIREFLGVTSVSPHSNIVSTWGSIKSIK